ncbi:hypothetical protein TNCT_141381, partial [Trichonephila clavata]
TLDPCTGDRCKMVELVMYLTYLQLCMQSSVFWVTCEENVCTDNPCLNGGTCYFDGSSFKCKCRRPYFEEKCDKETNQISIKDSIKNSSSVPSTSFAEGKRQATSFSNRKFYEIFDAYRLTSHETRKSSFDFNIPNEVLNSTRVANLTTNTINPMNMTLANTLEPETNMTITDELTEIVKDLNFTITDDDLIDNWTSRESSDFTYYLNTTYEPSSSSLVGNVTIQPDLCDNNKCVYGSCEVVGQAYRCNCQKGYSGFHCNESVKNQKVISRKFSSWFIVSIILMTFMTILIFGSLYFIWKIHVVVKAITPPVNIN